MLFCTRICSELPICNIVEYLGQPDFVQPNPICTSKDHLLREPSQSFKGLFGPLRGDLASFRIVENGVDQVWYVCLDLLWRAVEYNVDCILNVPRHAAGAVLDDCHAPLGSLECCNTLNTNIESTSTTRTSISL